MEMTRHYIVRGKVQGVGFRAFVKRVAEAFDIVGQVRNRPDGSVAITARGTEENLASFVEQVEIGPTSSRVDELETSSVESDTSFSEFAIVR